MTGFNQSECLIFTVEFLHYSEIFLMTVLKAACFKYLLQAFLLKALVTLSLSFSLTQPLLPHYHLHTDVRSLSLSFFSFSLSRFLFSFSLSLSFFLSLYIFLYRTQPLLPNYLLHTDVRSLSLPLFLLFAIFSDGFVRTLCSIWSRCYKTFLEEI